jgi:hypothetical protein
MINEYGAVGGMRIGRGTEMFTENLLQCHSGGPPFVGCLRLKDLIYN